MCVCVLWGGGGGLLSCSQLPRLEGYAIFGWVLGGELKSPLSHTHTQKWIKRLSKPQQEEGWSRRPCPLPPPQKTPNTTTNQPNKPTNRNQQNRKNYGAVTTVRCRSSLFTVTSGWKCSVWIVFRERAGHRSCSGYYFFFSLVVWCWQVLGISVGPAIVEVVKLVLIEICFFMICSAFSCWNQISGVW